MPSDGAHNPLKNKNYNFSKSLSFSARDVFLKISKQHFIHCIYSILKYLKVLRKYE